PGPGPRARGADTAPKGNGPVPWSRGDHPIRLTAYHDAPGNEPYSVVPTCVFFECRTASEQSAPTRTAVSYGEQDNVFPVP
ncbi:MAG: hypothetical protein KAT30_10270, partial [Candidatus Krumholzibacteria bacterium]|nr:hypothetical protein [Candidatus Krumholzibacteria bacterium]